MDDIFSDAFIATPVDRIAAEIQDTGIFVAEGAVRGDTVDRIFDEIGGLDFRVNVNTLLPVVNGHQTYQNHFMALSRTAFRLVASERVTSICDALLGSVYRVVGKRIYETRYGQYMSFHSDVGNKAQTSDAVEGLGFIFYMSDVDDGAFEIVEGSHRWGESGKGSRNNDAEMLRSHKIRRFPMPKGSYVIYNGRLLHRASPIKQVGGARQSFHFQVNRGFEVGEPIYVNIGWMNDISEKGKALLGHGVAPSQEASWPMTTSASIPKLDVLRMATHYVGGTLSRAVKGLLSKA